MKTTTIDYINFMMWFQSDPKHLDYDPVTAVNKYLEFLNANGNQKYYYCSVCHAMFPEDCECDGECIKKPDQPPDNFDQ